MRRLTCLDGLRGVLAFYVLLSHALPFAPLSHWLIWLFSHGSAAVDVFFILSGLVIVQSLASYGGEARPFLIARLARTYPAYLIVLVFAVAVQPLPTGFERMPWIEPGSLARAIWSEGWPHDWAIYLLTHLTMTHGVLPDGALPDVWLGFLGAAWSLSTEWQFYLLALALGRVSLDRLVWLFMTLAMLGIGWQFVGPEAWQFSRAFLPNKAQFFALGVASAALVRDGAGASARPSYALTLLAVMLLSAVQGGIEKAIAPLVWTLCLAAQLAPQVRLLRHVHRALTLPVSLWLGAVSYCLYLVNEPVQKLLGLMIAPATEGHPGLFTTLWLPAAIAAPLLAAWWLHLRIEAPALAWGRRLARSHMTAPLPVSAG
jgi:peptidoglycan/LPS O-acetylase OafA/YrhL